MYRDDLQHAARTALLSAFACALFAAEAIVPEPVEDQAALQAIPLLDAEHAPSLELVAALALDESQQAQLSAHCARLLALVVEQLAVGARGLTQQEGGLQFRLEAEAREGLTAAIQTWESRLDEIVGRSSEVLAQARSGGRSEFDVLFQGLVSSVLADPELAEELQLRFPPEIAMPVPDRDRLYEHLCGATLARLLEEGFLRHDMSASIDIRPAADGLWDVEVTKTRHDDGSVATSRREGVSLEPGLGLLHAAVLARATAGAPAQP